jgi:hypothetical protein
MQPGTRYAKSGDLHIAYQVFGAGSVDLVLVPGFISNVEGHCHENRSEVTRARMLGQVRPQRSRAATLASPRPGRSEASRGRRGGVEG